MHTLKGKKFIVEEVTIEQLQKGDYLFVYYEDGMTILWRICAFRETLLHNHKYLFLTRTNGDGELKTIKLYYDNNTTFRRLTSENKEWKKGVWSV